MTLTIIHAQLGWAMVLFLSVAGVWGLVIYFLRRGITTAFTNITEIDQDVTLALSRDVASISEELGETVRFSITLSQALNSGNSVSVDIADLVGGAETSSDTIQTLVAAIDAALPVPGVSRSTNTLTFTDAFVGTTFSFDLTTQDDALVEGTETLTLQLSNPVNNNGITGSYWGILAVGEILIVAQLVVGVILWIVSPGRAPLIHVLYGIVAGISIPGYYAYTRGRDDRRASLTYGLICLFLVGISFRAIGTAP